MTKPRVRGPRTAKIRRLITVRDRKNNDAPPTESEHSSFDAALGHALSTSEPRSIVAIHDETCGVPQGEACDCGGLELTVGAKA